MKVTHLAIHLLLTGCFYAQDSQSATCLAKYQVFPGHTGCLKKSPTAISIGINATVRNKILTIHNDLRGSVTPAATNMLKMNWDDDLEMLAQRWTDACDKQSGIFHHDSLRFVPGRFDVGQNLAVGARSFDQAIDLWYQEHTVYTFGATTDSSNLYRVGHYTQIVWAKTTRIGCGVTSCDGTLFYVCNYAPPGNYLPFTGPYTSGVRGNDCKTVDGGLCDCSGLVCENFGTMDPKTCSCSCMRPVYQLQPNCQLACNQTDNAHCGVATGFLESDCVSSYVSSDCPQTCNICPYAAPGYTESSDTPDRENSTARTSSMDTVLAVTLLATWVLRS